MRSKHLNASEPKICRHFHSTKSTIIIVSMVIDDIQTTHTNMIPSHINVSLYVRHLIATHTYKRARAEVNRCCLLSKKNPIRLSQSIHLTGRPRLIRTAFSARLFYYTNVHIFNLVLAYILNRNRKTYMATNRP